MALMSFLAVFTGANVVLCRFLNAGSAQKNGLSMSTLMNYITGLATSLLVLWFSGEKQDFHFQWAGFSTFAIFTGGLSGVITVLLSNYLTPRCPAFLLTLLIFLAQLFTAFLLDFWLSGVFSIGKLGGGIFVLLGLWHYQWVNRQQAGTQDQK